VLLFTVGDNAMARKVLIATLYCPDPVILATTRQRIRW